MKRSVLQDENPADAIDIHFKNYRRGALFLVFFAVFSSTSSWDWLMSIDIHWFSTLFGWYVFAGSWTSAMVVIIILLLYLKKLGYLPKVNESQDRKSTRLNSSHVRISYAVFCLKKKSK